MTSFRWLHLTDLHWGMKQQRWLWPKMKQKFFEDIEDLHEVSGPWDLVLFTGDITYKGSAGEFKGVDAELGQLWEHLGKIGSSPVLLAVPGNHDLARPNKDKPAVKLLKGWSSDLDVQSQFWDKPKCQYRSVVTQAFKNYSAWWKTQPHQPTNVRSGMLPGDFSYTHEKGEARLGILGLNTTFLQLTDGDYKGKLALHARQFHEACGACDSGPAWVRQHDACLLLTHQPPDWLNSDSREQLDAEISDPGQFAVHLFGHMHEPLLSSIAMGAGQPRNLWQGRSLFGMEFYVGSDGKAEVDRLHGFSVGKIDLDGKSFSLTFWPREARRLQGKQWKVVPDFSYELEGGHLPTSPITVPLLRNSSAKAKGSPSTSTAQLEVFVYGGGGDLVKSAPEPSEGGRRSHRHIEKEEKEEMQLVLSFLDVKELK